MNRLTTTTFAAALILLSTGVAATAQNYSFEVPAVQMEVFVESDASVRIVYDITFRNGRGAHPIDVVDIGTPTAGYDLKKIKATSGGNALRDIRHSEYVSPGFEVHMGAATIRPGAEGKLHVEFTVPDLVFQDTTREDYASLRITPTWFGGKFVRGNTHLQIAIQLPKSVEPDEVIHQGGVNFTQKAKTEQGARVGWDWPATRFTQPHMVAVSFPKRDMERVVRVTKLDLLLKWFSESTEARLIAGTVFLVLLGIAFFRFTGGTGIVIYVFLSALAVWLFVASPGAHLAAMPVVVVLVGLNEWFLHRRKAHYLPPIAQVEGGGIKRGLTAPEAAVLLELPLPRVLGLVVFGLLKKGVFHQLTDDPLCVSVDEPFQIKDQELLADEKARSRFYRKAGQKKGVVIHKYEHPFLFLVDANPGKPVKDIDFTVPIKVLIEQTAERMKGFDLSYTQDYYRSIVRRATRQAARIGDIPQREKAIDRNFEWILLDDDWPTVFTYGRPYRPIWSRGPTVSSGHGGFPAGGGGGAAAPSPGIPGKTSLGDVAGSFTGWTENTLGSMASAISPDSLNLNAPGGGFLDLSGADRVTSEFFQALSDAAASGGGSGGGGGGCACACAGCACACACAGGGR